MRSRIARMLGGRVARRLFLFFVLSAFLPLALIAALSLVEVKSLLLQQGEQRLAGMAKSYGMTLFERMLVATDLARSAANALPGQAEQQLARRTFTTLATLDAHGDMKPLLGRPIAPPLSEDAYKRLDVGQPVVMIMSREGVPRVLLLVATKDHDAQHLVVGELDPDYLWGTEDEVPASTDYCVIEERTGNVLHCTAPLDNGTWRALLASQRSSLGSATWERGGESYRGIAWPQFMGAGFGTHDWVVIASQPERFQLARAIEFRRLYVPVVALALLLVTWLTVRQARNIVSPLARLAARARGISHNDFSTRLALQRDDELGELGNAFDQMSDRLGRQFASLTALSEIDRLILSTPDTAQVIRTVLERLNQVVCVDLVSVTLLDHDNPSHARTYFRPPGEEGLAMVRQDMGVADHEALEATSAGHWIAVVGSAPAYLLHLREEGARTAYVQPIVWRGAVCGALALGYRNESSLSDDERRQARELADRVAVAVSSAWRDEQLYVQAHFDPLTALPNRLLFKDRLGQEISRSQREGLRFALLFVDLDHFKTVNDSFGHTTGDAILREAARRIATCVRASDTVARLGGDEFTVMLTNLAHAQEALLIAESIVATLSQEFQVNGQQCFLSASLGIASFPGDGTNADDLLKSADTAMYRAKSNGRAQAVYFEEKMNAEAIARLTLDRDLRVAIDRGELELHYQPKLDLVTGEIRAAEALVRWRHPTFGLISPVRFIPLAEESGFIEQVGHWTLRQASQQMRAWRSRGLPIDSVAVNVSPRQFKRRGLLEFINECISEAEVPPACIEIEITEGLLVDRGAAVEELLRRLSAMGHGIALDDFGTGFSSMAYLKRFPVRTLKIDRVFIEGLEHSADSEAIVTAIIAMAHALDKRVIAEGVENEAQLALLRRLRCDEIQGFYVAAALPADDFERFVLARAVLAVTA